MRVPKKRGDAVEGFATHKSIAQTGERDSFHLSVSPKLIDSNMRAYTKVIPSSGDWRR